MSRTSPSSHSGPGLMLGFVAGAAVGAVAALLLAPKPGAELRQQVRDSAGRARAKASTAYGDASEAVSQVVDRSRRALKAGRETFRDQRVADKADVRLSAS